MLDPKTLRYYDKIRNSSDPDLNLVAGGPADRIAGLERLLGAALRTTVLDVTCHKGTVSAAFAQAGATAIDGVDFWRPGLVLAREAVKEFATVTRFAACDLTGGIDALRAALAPMPDQYDVVLYLGVHQHLCRQMTPKALDSLVSSLCGLARRFFAIRTPEAFMAAVVDGIEATGLELWYDSDENKSVGPLKAYRRPDAAS